jgi:hypothetical protein
MAPVAHPAASVLAYRRREPEHTVLHQLVASEAGALRTALSAASLYGRGLPRHVDKELEAFLDCGLPHRGFSRVVCRRCRAEHLVAFSCKGRGVCPSCTGRRMADTAAHLVDRVLPRARYRQWVITFAPRVRHHLAAQPKLVTLALRESLRAIFGWQRRKARRLGLRPSRAASTGAVAFVQRFNSALELSIHFHVVIPDAVFIREGGDPDARPRTVPLDPPTDQDVASILDRILDRMTRLLAKHGRLEDEPDPDAEPQLAMALRGTRAPGGPRRHEPPPRLCARKQGFSLHAGSSVHAHDRQGLEHLCRYGLRPPLAQGRLERAEDGTIRYRMKRRFADGRHVLSFAPQAFLLRLCALVPPPRFQMIRYAGLFAPHARGRYAITGRGMHDGRKEPARKRAADTPAPSPPVRPDPDGPDNPGRQRRLDWAALMKRTFGVDVLRCPRCGERMRLIATIEDPSVAKKILEHLGLPARAPPLLAPWSRPARAQSAPDNGIDPPSLFD